MIQHRRRLYTLIATNTSMQLLAAVLKASYCGSSQRLLHAATAFPLASLTSKILTWRLLIGAASHAAAVLHLQLMMLKCIKVDTLVCTFKL